MSFGLTRARVQHHRTSEESNNNDDDDNNNNNRESSASCTIEPQPRSSLSVSPLVVTSCQRVSTAKVTTTVGTLLPCGVCRSGVPFCSTLFFVPSSTPTRREHERKKEKKSWLPLQKKRREKHHNNNKVVNAHTSFRAPRPSRRHCCCF